MLKGPDCTALEQGLRQAVAKLLVAWRNTNGNRLPERLIFYRDGVSEGQFRSVQMLEIPQIRMACEEVRSCTPAKLVVSYYSKEVGHVLYMCPSSLNIQNMSSSLLLQRSSTMLHVTLYGSLEHHLVPAA